MYIPKRLRNPNQKGVYVLNNLTLGRISRSSYIYKCILSTWQGHICPPVISVLYTYPSIPFPCEVLWKNFLEEEPKLFEETEQELFCERKRWELRSSCINLLRLGGNNAIYLQHNCFKGISSKERDGGENGDPSFTPKRRSRKLSPSLINQISYFWKWSLWLQWPQLLLWFPFSIV